MFDNFSWTKIKQGLQQYPNHFIILLGDGSSWIDGTYCAHSDEGETEIFYKDFTDLKDLEMAKKVCAWWFSETTQKQ